MMSACPKNEFFYRLPFNSRFKYSFKVFNKNRGVMSIGLSGVSSTTAAAAAAEDRPRLQRSISSHNLGPKRINSQALPIVNINLPPPVQNVSSAVFRSVPVSDRPLEEINKQFSLMSVKASSKNPV
jgi:hypothetical protein